LARAKKDARFLSALKALESKIVDGKLFYERVSPKLKALEFCKKGQPSESALERYREVVENIRNM